MSQEHNINPVSQQVLDDIDEIIADLVEPTPEEETEQIVEAVEEQSESLYPEPRPTLEEFREIVEELNESDAVPEPQPINIGTVPEGVNPEQIIETYQQTGTLITDGGTTGNITIGGTDAVTGVTYINVDNPSPADNGDEEEVEVDDGRPMRGGTLRRRAEAKKGKPQRELPFEDNSERGTPKEREIRKKKREGAKVRVKREAARKVGPHGHFLTTKEMMVLVGSDLRPSIVTTDTEEPDSIISKYNDGRYDRTGNNYMSRVHGGIMYDKNMNPVTIDITNYRDCQPAPLFPSVSINRSMMNETYVPDIKKRYLIIDRESFVRSKGSVMKILRRHNLTPKEATIVKRKMRSRIEDVDTLITNLKTIVGGIYDEANFEIIISEDFRNYTWFHVFIRFPNLTLTNSIEQEHLLNDIVIRLDGVFVEKHYVIQRSMYGMRFKFSPLDGVAGYLHSHLPRGIQTTWKRFCMGSGHFLSKIGSTTSDMEFEGIVLAAYDHVAWESLEGGPYHKMESIGMNSHGIIEPSNFVKAIGSYGDDFLRGVFNELKTLDLSGLMNTFSLSLTENKEVTYIYDSHLFYSKFVQLFNEAYVRRRSGDHGYSLYQYDHDEKVFHHVDEDGVAIGKKSEMVQSAKNKIKIIQPLYMNGEYILPEVIYNKDEEEEIIKNRTICFHPDVMNAVLRFIHYNLLTELKNDGKQTNQKA